MFGICNATKRDKKVVDDSILYKNKLMCILPIILVTVIAFSSFGNSYADSLIATVTVGNTPRDVSSGGSLIYVANYNDGTVSVISGTSVIGAPIIVGSNPYGIAYDSLHQKVYVTNSGDNSVSVIDPNNGNSVVTIGGIGPGPTGIAYNSANHEIYVANSGDNTVSVIDPNNGNSVTSIKAGVTPIGIAYDGLNQKVYVTNSGDNTVSVIDPNNGNSVTSIGGLGSHPFSITFDSQNGFMYVTNYYSNTVSIIDASHNVVIGNQIQVGAYPAGIAYDGLNQKVYVANYGNSTVSIIDPNNGNSLTSITVDDEPCGVAVDSSGNIFVSNIGINKVTVISPTSTGKVGSIGGNEETPPLTLNVPNTITEYPTSHLGVLVNYDVSASGGITPVKPVSCDSLSGTIFPIGTTTVTCTVSDSSGKSAKNAFTVHVLSSSEITNQIITQIDDINPLQNSNTPFGGLYNSLYVKISQYSTTTGQTNQVNSINAFLNEVQAKCCGTNGKPLTTDQANNLTVLANHLLAALS